VGEKTSFLKKVCLLLYKKNIVFPWFFQIQKNIWRLRHNMSKQSWEFSAGN